jgi:hypothetical protein
MSSYIGLQTQNLTIQPAFSNFTRLKTQNLTIDPAFSNFIQLQTQNLTMEPLSFYLKYHKQAVNNSISAVTNTVNPQVEKTSHFMQRFFTTMRTGSRKIIGQVSRFQKKCTAKIVNIYTKLATVIKETWKDTDPKKIKAHLPPALWKGFLLTIGGAALCALASLVVIGSFVAQPYNPSAGLGLIGLFAEVLGLTSMLGGLAVMLKNS